MILLLESIHDDGMRLLEAADSVELVADLDAFDPGAFAEVRAIVTRGRGRVTADLIAEFPDLLVVARCGAGLDNVDTQAAEAAGVAVAHAPGVTTAAVAEHAVMLMLATARRLVYVDTAVKSGNWAVREGFVGIEMTGKRLGIVGYGAIGARVGDLGTALGMDVVYTTRREGLPVTTLPFDELLSTSDVIQVCVPLTDQTRGMFGADQFALMKSTAVLVNTARGPIVDHRALADALDGGRLGGYGADVWDPEPPEAGDRVLDHPATVITPHVAGLTDRTYREICVGPAEAVAAIVTGEMPDPRWIYGT